VKLLVDHNQKSSQCSLNILHHLKAPWHAFHQLRDINCGLKNKKLIVASLGMAVDVSDADIAMYRPSTSTSTNPEIVKNVG
jgi:hypothetical protein